MGTTPPRSFRSPCFLGILWTFSVRISATCRITTSPASAILGDFVHPSKPGHSDFAALWSHSSFHWWVLGSFDCRYPNEILLITQAKESTFRTCLPSCLGEGQFLPILPGSYRTKKKKSQINISINYPATSVYPLNVGTVYLSFKLLLNSIEQSILSYRIYHREITCRCSSRNVRFLN